MSAGAHRELIDQLTHAARILADRECLPASDGNFSARTDEHHVAITRSGIEKRVLTPDCFVLAALADERPQSVSGEWLLHRALYLARPEVNCVIHVHAPYLCSFAVCREIPDVNLLAEAVLDIREIVLVPYYPPGSADLANQLLKTSRHAGVYLLSNHGAVSVGCSITEALHRMERAEFLAKVELQARILGTLQPLNSEQSRILQGLPHAKPGRCSEC